MNLAGDHHRGRSRITPAVAKHIRPMKSVALVPGALGSEMTPAVS